MSKVLVIGAGGVASVAVHKMAQLPQVFGAVTLASRRRFKCDAVAASVKERFGYGVETAEVDADDVEATAALIERVGPKLVVNLALPYQDLSIMEACLRTGTDYLDTANYERATRRSSNINGMGSARPLKERADGVARSGFDPGVTRCSRLIRKHLLDRIETLDILAATAAITASISRPTSIRRSTSARSPRRRAILRAGSGSRPRRSRPNRRSTSIRSGPRTCT